MVSSKSEHPVWPSLVRIRGAGGEVVGAGFLVAPDLVCTCAHVVTAALRIRDDTATAPSSKVHLDFPVANGFATTASVVGWQPRDKKSGAGDIAALRLSSPLPAEAAVAPLVSRVALARRAYTTVGFPNGQDAGAFSSGEFSYRVGDGSIQIWDTNVTGFRVQKGFSGGPVWDEVRRSVVGMVVAAEMDTAAKVAFIIPCDLLEAVCGLTWTAPLALDDQLEPLLRPISFAGEIAKHIPTFSGRDSVFQDLRAWLKDPDGARARWILGVAGTGKSAIAAAFCSPPHNAAAAVHLFVYGGGSSADPRCCLRSVAGQLSRRLPAYAEFLNSRASELQTSLTQPDVNVATLIDVLYRQPFVGHPTPDEPILIVFDALDEATVATANELADSIGVLLSATPHWLRLLITCRPEPEVMVPPYRTDHAIELREDTNKEEIRAYLNRLEDRRLSPEAVETIVDHSEGVFLYVKVVLEELDELAKRHLSLQGWNELPVGLNEAYLRCFKRRFPDLEDYNTRVLPVLRVLAAAFESPPRQMLREMFGARPEGLSATDRASDRYLPAFEQGAGEKQEQFFRSLESLFSIRNPRQVLRPFHKSVLDWLTCFDGAGKYAVDHAEGHRALADYCWRVSQEALGGHEGGRAFLSSYAARYGVRHLLESGRYADAVTLLDYLLDHASNAARKTDKPTLDGDDVSQLAKLTTIALGQPEIPADEVRRIDPDKLARLIEGLYMTEPLFGGVHLLLSYHRERWPVLLDRFLKSEDYVLRHTIAEALAANYLEGDPDDPEIASRLEEVRDLLKSQDINRRELGGYAIAMIYGEQPSLIDPESVNILADGETYFFRSILGDMLLGLALPDYGGKTFERADKMDLVLPSTRFWNPVWEFNRMDVSWLLAAKYLVRKREPPADFPPGARAAYDSMLRTEAARQKLLREPGVRSEETILSVLTEYYALSVETGKGRVRAAQRALASSPHLKAVCEVLFAHPVWTVTETAASALASIVDDDGESRQLVRELFAHDEWRVTYGAAETAFLTRFTDNNELFTEALRRFHKSPHPLLRGNCVENLGAWILDSNQAEKKRLLRDFGDLIRGWLSDPHEDCWVLDHLHRLFHTLMRSPEDARLAADFVDGVSPLLQGTPAWYELERLDFLRRIEEVRLRSPS